MHLGFFSSSPPELFPATLTVCLNKLLTCGRKYSHSALIGPALVTVSKGGRSKGLSRQSQICPCLMGEEADPHSQQDTCLCGPQRPSSLGPPLILWLPLLPLFLPTALVFVLLLWRPKCVLTFTMRPWLEAASLRIPVAHALATLEPWLGSLKCYLPPLLSHLCSLQSSSHPRLFWFWAQHRERSGWRWGWRGVRVGARGSKLGLQPAGIGKPLQGFTYGSGMIRFILNCSLSGWRLKNEPEKANTRAGSMTKCLTGPGRKKEHAIHVGQSILSNPSQPTMSRVLTRNWLLCFSVYK